MPLTHVMLDLETLDLGPQPALLQIGAVTFDPAAAEPAAAVFEATLDVDSCLAAGLTIGGETLRWWFRRSDGARAAVIGAAPYEPVRGSASTVIPDRVPLTRALDLFRGWLSLVARYDDVRESIVVWSHGAAFDAPILEAAYRAVGQEPPWDHRNVRDTRTLFWLAGERGWERERRGTAHSAVADAIGQARDVQAAYRYLIGDDP